MAQRVTGFAKRRPVAKTSRVEDSARSVAEAVAALRAVPLDIAPLLLPYKGRGRLSVRVERLPIQARLSRGRNNGDHSWSLMPDELEELAYLSPEGVDAAPMLAVRIISLDGDGASTLALLDFQVSSSDARSDPPPGRAPRGASVVDLGDSVELRRLRDDLTRTKASLVARESELAEMRQEAELESGLSPQAIEAELAVARSAWKAELDARLTATAAAAAAKLEASRSTWQEEQNARFAASEERAQKRALEERERWQRETDTALSKAEKAWKAAEAARLAAAEAQWREQSAGALAKVGSKAKAAREPAGDAIELRRLRDQFATMQSALADRETELAEARSATKQMQQRLRQDADAALSKAEKTWKAAEAARLTAAEAQWQEKSARALAEARAEAKVVRNRGDAIELRHLRDELTAMHKALADRQTELVQAQSAIKQTQEQSRQEAGVTLSKAEKAWKAAEAARLAAAEAQWQENSARGLAEARAEAKAVRDRGDAFELRHLRDELTAMQKTLVDRETELVQARSATKQTQERLRQEADAALSKAEKAWKAAEAARLAAAEAQWQEKSARALAEARAEAQAARGQGDADFRRLRHELAAMQKTLVDCETELVRARSATKQTQERLRQEADAALSKAEKAWKAAEATRLAAAEAQWREKSTKALSETRAEAKAVREQRDIALCCLRDELVALQERICRSRDSVGSGALDHGARARTQDRTIRSGIVERDKGLESRGNCTPCCRTNTMAGTIRKRAGADDGTLRRGASGLGTGTRRSPGYPRSRRCRFPSAAPRIGDNTGKSCQS